MLNVNVILNGLCHGIRVQDVLTLHDVISRYCLAWNYQACRSQAWCSRPG